MAQMAAVIIEGFDGLDIRNAAQYGDHAGPVRIRVLGRTRLSIKVVSPSTASSAAGDGYERARIISRERNCLVVTVAVEDDTNRMIAGTLNWYLYGLPIGFGMIALSESSAYLLPK